MILWKKIFFSRNVQYLNFYYLANNLRDISVLSLQQQSSGSTFLQARLFYLFTILN